MTRTLTLAGAIALAASAMVSAQTAPLPMPRPKAPASPGTTRQADPAPITVTGCLKPWDASTTPAQGLGAGAAGRFLLTDVEANTPGTATPGMAAPVAPAPKTQYVVTADAGVNLNAHLNHKVRITGMVAKSDASAPAEPPAESRPADPKPAPAPGAGADSWTGLTALSVTLVSATCPSPTR